MWYHILNIFIYLINSIKNDSLMIGIVSVIGVPGAFCLTEYGTQILTKAPP